MKLIPHLTVVIITRQMSDDLAKMIEEIEHYAKVLTIQPESQITDFAAVRNAALEKVETTWTFFLDDDEVPDGGLWRSVSMYVEKYDSGNGPPGSFRRRDWWLNRWLVGGDAGANVQIRLLPTQQGQFARAVHETYVHNKKLSAVLLDGTLWHYPHTSTSDFISAISHYLKLEGSIPNSFQFPVIGLLFPFAKFVYLYFVKMGWRDGFAGLSHAVIMSIFSLGKRARIYEESHH